MVEDEAFSRLHSRFTLPLHDASNTTNGIIKPLIIIDLVMLQKYVKVLSFGCWMLDYFRTPSSTSLTNSTNKQIKIL